VGHHAVETDGALAAQPSDGLFVINGVTVDPDLAESIVDNPSRACATWEGDDVAWSKVTGRVVVYLQARVAGEYKECLAGL
jgi:hypothetical protein